MVQTVKFSDFGVGNYNTTTNFMVGTDSLSGGTNIRLPFTTTWTTVGRPGTPYVGLSGFNSTIDTYEFWNGTSWISFLSGLPALTNGQVWIGNTGNPPTASTLTAGTNISISNGVGTITISATGAGGFAWNHITTTSSLLTSNTGFVIDNAGLVTLTLPVTSALGDEIEIVGRGAGGWLVNYGTGQQVIYGNQSSTITSGDIASTNRSDSISLICTAANTEWTIQSSVGVITVN